MFSPLNDPQVEDWFRRLDAAWRRMPAEERTRQREEVQQHLEGLVAAKVSAGQSAEEAWSFALAQFGNPAQIGRKIYREWRLSRTGLRADVMAILFGLSLSVSNYCLVQLLFALPLIAFYCTGSQNSLYWSSTPAFYAVLQILYFGGAFLIYGLIGRKYPFQAIKGALFTYVLSYLFGWTYVIAFLLSSHGHLSPAMVTRGLPYLPLHLVCIIALAYLASVTKRGWYKPTFEDYKLTLPRRGRVAT